MTKNSCFLRKKLRYFYELAINYQKSLKSASLIDNTFKKYDRLWLQKTFSCVRVTTIIFSTLNSIFFIFSWFFDHICIKMRENIQKNYSKYLNKYIFWFYSLTNICRDKIKFIWGCWNSNSDQIFQNPIFLDLEPASGPPRTPQKLKKGDNFAI